MSNRAMTTNQEHRGQAQVLLLLLLRITWRALPGRESVSGEP